MNKVWLIAAALLAAVACSGGGEEPGAENVVSGGEGAEGLTVKGAAGQGEASDTVKLPPEPAWWSKVDPADRLVVVYSGDVHGEIEPCG